MKILILLCIIAFTLGRSQTMELIDQVVENDWVELKEYLNEQKILLIDDMRLSERNREKILSLQLPKLKELHFQKKMEFQTAYKLPYDWSVTITAETLKTVFMSQYFPKLEVLNLFRTNIDDRALQFLDQIHLKTKIRNLNLQGLFIGAKGFERLSHINFTNLQILNIKETLLSKDQTITSLIKMICGSDTEECKNNLISLNIQSTNIGRQGFINLFSRLNSTSLRNLTINGLSMVLDKTYKDGFNYSAYEYLSKHYFNLQVLNMQNSFIDDNIAEIFSTWQLNRLKTLNIEQNFLSDEGVIKWINKKNLPKLTNIYLKSNQVGDGTIGHFIEEAIQFTSFSFGDCLITKEGFEQFIYLDFTQLEKLVIYGNINSDTLQQMAYEGSFQQLKYLAIQKSDYITNLFFQLDWSFFPKIDTILISNCDLKDFYASTVNFMSGVQISDNLRTLALFQTSIQPNSLQFFMFTLQYSFPKLQSLIINQQQSNLYILPYILSEGSIRDETYININLMSYQKSNGKFKVLFITEIFYLVIEQQNPSYQEFIRRIPSALDIFDLSQLEGVFFSNRQNFDVFFRFLDVAQITSLPHLKFFQYATETDIEFLIDYLEGIQLPSMKLFFLSFVVPGDVESSFLNNRLIPYLQRFPNLQTLSLNMAFLNQQRGFIQRQQLIQSLHYPRLKQLQMPVQNMEVQQIQQFLKKHYKTLRVIDLSNNFLEHGFLQILVKYQFILMSLSLSSTSFTVQQFSLLKDLSFDYMRTLQLNQNDLTDEHIFALIGDKDKSHMRFPKLFLLHLQYNDIRSQGLTALFETGLYQIKQLQIQGNSNPNFFNILLSYPSRIQSFSALQVQIYGIQNDLDPRSARNIKAMQIKAQSFISEDFHNLGRLNFNKLFYVQMDIYNVYECQVLRDILKIAKNTRVLLLSINNDQEGLKSQCLKEYKMESKMQVVAVIDIYTTTYIPQFAALALNSASVLKFIAIQNTRFSPSFFKKSILPHFSDAFVLFLDRNYFGDEVIKLLSTEQNIIAQALMLRYNNITDASFKQISNQNIVQIQLDGNKLGPVTLTNIKKSKIPNLRSITFNNCDLDGEGLAIISTFQFDSLQELHLDNNNFSEDDILQFVSELDRKRLPQLGMVSINGVSLNKDIYKSITQVLTAKSLQYRLDQSHNLVKENAAKY